MKFFHENVPVSSSQEPPEEILASLTGACAPWQITIILMCFTAQLISGIQQELMRFSIKPSNYMCATGNGSKCFTVNGSKCDSFTFYEKYNISVISKKFLLICDKEDYVVLLFGIHISGLVLGYFVSASFTQKIGGKMTCSLFIPLQCLFGYLLLTNDTLEAISVFIFGYSLFCTAIELIPVIAVCDSVGNRWRTLAMGVAYLPCTVVKLLFPTLYFIFNDVSGVIGVAAILPLVLLAPLMYFKDSPNYICLYENSIEVEKVFNYIGRVNSFPLPFNVKIRQAKIIKDNSTPRKCGFWDIWKQKKTRKAYLALLCLWFFSGFGRLVSLKRDNFFDFFELTVIGICSTFGSILSIVLCHISPHKMVIGVSVMILSILSGVEQIIKHLEIDTSKPDFLVMYVIRGTMTWVVLTSLSNLTPRMFPTEIRPLGVAMNFAVHTIGIQVYRIINISPKFVRVTMGSLLLLCSPVIIVLCHYLLWNVHNRELPDFLSDCICFEKFYKPTRFVAITNKADEEEIEIKNLELDDSYEDNTGVSEFSSRTWLQKM